MKAKITDGFWRERLDVNASRAIFHQWEQLEASGCIENFRIAAGDVNGLRTGWYFADSDAYKWLDAASRIYASVPDPRLASLMDELITLLERAQQPDGYLFTYNQIHFPGTRWVNLQIEHELYCHGHLLEAGVAHYQATGRKDALEIAQRAANRIVEDFRGKGADHTDGHEEIELALLRLYEVTHHEPYLELARQFIEQRGRNPSYILTIRKERLSANERAQEIRQRKQAYLAAHPEFKPYQLPPGNVSKEQPNSRLRRQISEWSGKYYQQHLPVRKQRVPVGHAVRFGYLETAIAMLARAAGDTTLLPSLEAAWKSMIGRRMYVTGGIGSLPGLEGFGNDYELDPEYAYAETCAALASLFWNWEMVQLTGDAKYSDLFEWQLYNAASVGMGTDGETYLYNNPLACRGGVTRKPWYAVPCCPSNLSRTWADLGKYIFSTQPGELTIHQYISSEIQNQTIVLEDGKEANVGLTMSSGFPYEGLVRIKITSLATPAGDLTVPFTMNLRQPSWMSGLHITINGISEISHTFTIADGDDVPASGLNPLSSTFYPIHRNWVVGDELFIAFEMPIIPRRAQPQVKGHRGKMALTRGPLVYCLESVDNPDLEIFNVRVDVESLDAGIEQTDLGEIMLITGKSVGGQSVRFIPYFLWGNRGESEMTVWVNE